jgi:hypothetical protein
MHAIRNTGDGRWISLFRCRVGSRTTRSWPAWTIHLRGYLCCLRGLGNTGSLAATEFIASNELAGALARDKSCKGKSSFEAVIGTEIIEARPDHLMLCTSLVASVPFTLLRSVLGPCFNTGAGLRRLSLRHIFLVPSELTGVRHNSSASSHGKPRQYATHVVARTAGRYPRAT